jgi:putative phage-type endonuclease
MEEPAVQVLPEPAEHEQADLKLANWIEALQNNILQHTDEWHAARRYTIGGSSVATIMGLNPFETMSSLVTNRLGITSFNGNINTEWGNIFEPLICSYISRKYNTDVVADKYFIKNGSLSYSPDGLCVIDNKVVLLEFKCPFTRIPDKAPPKYYVPQVKMGLEMIPIASHGLFVEAIYRKCSWVDLRPDNMEYEVFDRQKDIGEVDEILDYGFVGFYLTKEHRGYNHLISDFIRHFGSLSEPTDMHDISEVSKCLFEQIIMYPHIGKYYSSADHSLALEDDLRAFGQLADADVLFGILPWKLLRVKETIIEKTPGYLTPWMDKINSVTTMLAECSDPENKLKIPNILDSFLLEQGIGFY